MTTRLLLLCSVALSGCAVLHRTGIGELEPQGSQGIPIDIRVSETGFDIKGAASAGRSLTQRYGNRNARDAGSTLETIVALTNMAPQVGNPTVTDTWADSMAGALREKCPNGKITNIQFVRETAKYPLVSGEIVRISALCIPSSRRES